MVENEVTGASDDRAHNEVTQVEVTQADEDLAVRLGFKRDSDFAKQLLARHRIQSAQPVRPNFAPLRLRQVLTPFDQGWEQALDAVDEHFDNRSGKSLFAVDRDASAPPARADVVEAAMRAFDETEHEMDNYLPAPGESAQLAMRRRFKVNIEHALRTNQAPTDAPEAGLAGGEDWLRGDWYERWQDATENADDGLMATLESLRMRVEGTILAALNHADPASDDVRELLREARARLLGFVGATAEYTDCSDDVEFIKRLDDLLGDTLFGLRA